MQDHHLINKYFKDLSRQQQEQFASLKELYIEWNSKINVISRKDMEQFYVHHVLHSLGIGKMIRFKKETEILDVGTGGGFPGIPLAILFPESQFHLIDSIGKKIMVVEEVSKALGLDNVKASQVRAEQVNDEYDFIISRAVTRMKPFLQWISGNIKPKGINDLQNGILYLKGGDLKQELKEARKQYTLYHLADYFDEEFFETKKVVHISM